MGRQKKNKFDDLDADFRSNVESLSDEEIKSRVAQIALDNELLLKAKEDDEDLKEKVQIAKEAGAVYREGVKMNRTKIQYAQMILESRGKA
ncbi:hypothetical protein EBT16_01130 [bacterium]|nr:hypothetical protein [bacterium]